MNPFVKSQQLEATNFRPPMREKDFKITYYKPIDNNGTVGVFGMEVDTNWMTMVIQDMWLKRDKRGNLFIDTPKKKYVDKEGMEKYFPLFDIKPSAPGLYISERMKAFGPIMKALEQYLANSPETNSQRDQNIVIPF